MAKAKPTKTAIARTAGSELLGLDEMRVNLSDVIAIGVQQVEDALNATIRQKTASANALEKQAKEAKQAVADEAVAALQAEMKPQYDALRTAIQALGGVVSFKVEATQDHQGTIKHCARATATVKHDIASNYNSTISFVVSRVYSADRMERVAAADRLQEEAGLDRAVVVDARRQKADLSSVERSLRATLASRTLQSQAGGQELLDVLLGDVRQQIASLPGH